jgi:hypothetical protein
VRDIHEYLADALIKEVSVFGKTVGAERIAKSLKMWEEVYGSAVTGKARKLITADWRKRFKVGGSGLGPQGGGHRTDARGGEPAQARADEALDPA